MTDHELELPGDVARDEWVATRNEPPKKGKELIRLQADCHRFPMIGIVGNRVPYAQRNHWRP